MAKKTDNQVANPGSAIGEHIGNRLETVINDYITKFLEDYQCHFIRETGFNPLTKKNSKKLIEVNVIYNRITLRQASG